MYGTMLIGALNGPEFSQINSKLEIYQDVIMCIHSGDFMVHTKEPHYNFILVMLQKNHIVDRAIEGVLWGPHLPNELLFASQLACDCQQQSSRTNN